MTNTPSQSEGAAPEPLPRPVRGDVPQRQPALIRDAKNAVVAALKVDAAELSTTGTLSIDGWCLGEKRFELLADGRVLAPQIRHRKRPDVARFLAVDEPMLGFGFSMSAAVPTPAQGFRLRWLSRRCPPTAVPEFTLDVVRPDHHDEMPRSDAPGAEPVPPERFLAQGHLDHAGAVFGRFGLVAGWVARRPGDRILLGDSRGNVMPVEQCLRYQRADIVDLFGSALGRGTIDAGLLAPWPYPQRPGDAIRLLHDRGGEPRLLFERTWDALPEDAVGYAKWAFGVATPSELFNRRLDAGEGRFLQDLIEQDRARALAEDRPPDIWTIGTPPASPSYSVIVPLYGRWDFIEHQLLELTADDVFADTAELLYVIDDPKLVTPILAAAEDLLHFYQLPFKLVWGHRNRGFAGANNLGAGIARGTKLLFLNSDAFPCRPGWLRRMGQALDADPGIGVLGVRLVSPDGGIQHAGMDFFFSRTWEVWLNKHPLMGLDTEYDGLDPGTVVERPAVTGACMLMDRADFEGIGGFDEGYLIGDFEDSDLCMKARQLGKRIGCLAASDIVHLERQSFAAIGDASFRSLVVRFNAWRHHQRWGDAIAELMQDRPTAGRAGP